MNKNQVIRIFKKYGFSENDYEKIFLAMSEVLEAAARQLEKDEPYAKIPIDNYLSMSTDLSDMQQFIINNNLY